MTKSAPQNHIELPVLKLDPGRLFSVIQSVYLHEYDREGFKDAVLKLFPGRGEKSVFRGIVIPSLRRLGLIIGFEELIRLSSDGALIAEALQDSRKQGKRALSAFLVEYEYRRKWGIIKALRRKTWIRRDYVLKAGRYVKAPNLHQARERISDWLNYLCFASVLNCNECIQVNNENLAEAERDLDIEAKRPEFPSLLLRAYKHVMSVGGISTVEIEDVRKVLSRIALREKNLILTSIQFDDLLRSLLKTPSPKYLISFGRSMGADEKLFEFRGNFYQTITVRFPGELAR